MCGGRFQLHRDAVLGRGGFAVVRRGEDTTESGRAVAVKCFNVDGDHADADDAAEEGAVDRSTRAFEQFEREYGILQRLHADASSKPPPVVGLIDYSRHGTSNTPGPEADGSCYLVLELGDITLDQFLAERGTIPPAETRELLTHLLGCLAWLQTMGFVHLDFKFSNCMRFSGSWKLVDCDAIMEIGTVVDRRAAPVRARAMLRLVGGPASKAIVNLTCLSR